MVDVRHLGDGEAVDRSSGVPKQDTSIPESRGYEKEDLPSMLAPFRPLVDAVAGVRANVHVKLLSGFLLGALLLLGMAILSSVVMNRINAQVNELSRLQEKMDRSRQMEYLITAQSHFRAMALLTNDDANNQKIANAKAAFAQNLEAVETLSPREQAEFFDQIRETSVQFDASSAKALSLYEAGNVDEALQVHLWEEHPISHVLEDAARHLIRGSEAEMAESRFAFESDRRFLRIVVMSFSGISLLLALVLGLVMSWSFIRPVRKINNALVKISSGDFRHRVEVANRDEFGALSRNLNRTSEHLAELYDKLSLELVERKRAEEALSESEERSRVIIQTALDAVVIMDTSGLITGWNPQAEAIFGWPAEDALGHRLSELIIPQQYREAHQQGLQRFLATSDGPVLNKRVEITALHRDGHEFPVELAISPARLGDATVFSAFIRDITERKRSEEALKNYTQELASINSELESFSYSVSHDLQAPLRGIDGFSLALLEDYSDKLDEEGRDYLQRVRAASQRMSQLINDLLNLSRVTRADIMRQRVDLSGLANEIASELHAGEPERQVTFSIAEGIVVTGDNRLLRVMLENLLGNAWKYTGKRQHATIEFGMMESDGKPVCFVRDDGTGFDMAYAKRLFTPFQRLHSSSDFEGSGVGLATVQRVINRHGGKIWAEAAIDQGATFYFTLS